MRWRLCDGVYARVVTFVQHAAQGCGGFKRSAHSAGPFLGSAAYPKSKQTNPTQIERTNQPTHPPHQPSNPNNQPTLFWLSRGVVFLCGSFPTFSPRLVDFGTLWDASWDHFGTIFGAKISKNAVWGSKWSQVGSRKAFYQCDPSLGEDFWVPLGSPKSAKNRFVDPQNRQVEFSH